MWYWWHKVRRAANIPPALRNEFEEFGETVVAQICGRPYTHAAEQTLGVPGWAGEHTGRRDALLWLREKHDEAERRHDITVAMEVAIIVLVAMEVVLSLVGLWPVLAR
jgi:hypothetical protein